MHTIVSSATRTVTIGHDQPFAIIGERINPTGRATFQRQLRDGDLSRIEIDVAQQVAGGAMLLDVNMGAPLADEAELMVQAITLIQRLTDLPLVIDSSIPEVLEAGLRTYQGKALVNSVTAEDERLHTILPLVKRYGAAVIGLPNDEEQIPDAPEDRLVLTRKLIRTATDTYQIPVEDIVIDPLAMPVGADTGNTMRTLETLALVREEFGVNTTCGASNLSFGMPDRHALTAAFLPLAAAHGLTSAIMDARTPQVVTAARAADLLLGHDDWGAAWIAAFRAAKAAGADLTAMPADSVVSQRVDLRFNGRPVRVPQGVTLFDAASWNGIAIDSTCGGHGTCKKCRIRFKADPPVPTSLDLRAYTTAEIKDGWRLACRTLAITDADVEVPPLVTRPKAATVGVGRQVILRPAVRKRYLELAEPSLADQVTDLERVLGELTDLGTTADLAVLRALGGTLRQSDFKVTAVIADETLIAVEPGDTTGRAFGLAFDLGTTTVVATLLDLTTGTPAAVESMLNKQQPFGADVIARISATMLDPAARDRLRQLAQETLAELATRPARPAACGRTRSTRSPSPATPPWSTWSSASTPSRSAWPRSSCPPGCCPRSAPTTWGSPPTRRPARWSSPRSAPTSAATSPPACWPAAWTATRASACSSTSAPTARSSSAAATGCWPPPPRPAPPSRAPPSAAACAPPTAPSRRSRSPATATSSSP